MLYLLRMSVPVSYTHLDVYKRQDQDCGYPYPEAEKKAGLGGRHTDHNQGGVSA